MRKNYTKNKLEPDGTVRYSLRVDPDLYDEVKIYCIKNNISVNALINKILSEKIGYNKTDAESI